MNSLNYKQGTFFQTVKDGVQEIIGVEGMHAVMGAGQRGSDLSEGSHNPEAAGHEMNAFFASIERVFGRLAGQGIQQRGGRISFDYLFRLPEYDEAFSSVSRRLVPVPVRIRQGLEILSDPVSNQLGMRIHVGEDDQSWFWQIAACPLCTGNMGASGGCYYLVGLVQGLTSWMSGGRFFDVQEVNCIAARDEACLIRVSKIPLE